MTPQKITKPYKEIDLEFYAGSRGHWFEIRGEKVPYSPSKLSNLPDKPGLKFWYADCMAKELLEKIKIGNITEQDIADAKMAWKRALDQAADIGSQVHKYAELFVKGEKPAIPEHPKAKNGVLAFQKFMSQHRVKVIEPESHVYSRKYKIAGIMDALAEVDGRLTVLDYKAAGPKNPLPLCCEGWAREQLNSGGYGSSLLEKREDGYTCKNCGGDCEVKTDGVYSSYHYQTSIYQVAREEMEPQDGRITLKEGEILDRWVVRFDKLTGQFEAHKLEDRKKDEECWKALLKVAKREEELE